MSASQDHRRGLYSHILGKTGLGQQNKYLVDLIPETFGTVYNRAHRIGHLWPCVVPPCGVSKHKILCLDRAVVILLNWPQQTPRPSAQHCLNLLHCPMSYLVASTAFSGEGSRLNCALVSDVAADLGRCVCAGGCAGAGGVERGRGTVPWAGSSSRTLRPSWWRPGPGVARGRAGGPGSRHRCRAPGVGQGGLHGLQRRRTPAGLHPGR